MAKFSLMRQPTVRKIERIECVIDEQWLQQKLTTGAYFVLDRPPAPSLEKTPAVLDTVRVEINARFSVRIEDH